MTENLRDKILAFPFTQEILILAPTGQDAHLIAATVKELKITAIIVKNVAELCERINQVQVVAVIIAEEALSQASLEHLNLALECQGPWSDIPIILMTKKGEVTLALLQIKEAFSPSGNITLLERPFRKITLVSGIDVAIRSRLKQYEMRYLLEKHQMATRIRDEFISLASHELKTPLTSLKLQTQMSERQIKKDDLRVYQAEQMRKFIFSTSRQVDRLSRLVEDMLDISRINSGKLKLELSKCDLKELVLETVDRLMPQLEMAGCQLDIVAEGDLHGTWDCFRIEQVMNNLLTNVIRYCPGKPVHISMMGKDGNVQICVQDEGPGIAPENIERIFNRFERAVSASDISGLGLGLYICRKIIEAHRGTIHVESENRSGSLFVINLPAHVSQLQENMAMSSDVQEYEMDFHT